MTPSLKVLQLRWRSAEGMMLSMQLILGTCDLVLESQLLVQVQDILGPHPSPVLFQQESHSNKASDCFLLSFSHMMWA